MKVEDSMDQHLQQQKKRRKKFMLKLLVILLILLSACIILTVTYLTLLKGNKEEPKGPYAKLRPRYVYSEEDDIQMVDLKDIPSEEPIEEWATKKDAEYAKDISESFPEEVSNKAKAVLKEQEIGYVEKDISALDELAKTITDEDRAKYKVLDIALPEDLQIFAQQNCEFYGLDYAVLLALMESESSFRSDIGNEKILGGEDGGPRYYGYMQLSWDNCEKAELFALKPHTPEGNIEYAIIILSNYMEDYENDISKAIMCYKGGEGAAKSWIESGYVLPTAKKVEERTGYFRSLLEE